MSDLLKETSLSNQNDDYLLLKYAPETEHNNMYLIEGCLHHDIYHLGQIGLTIKLINLKK